MIYSVPAFFLRSSISTRSAVGLKPSLSLWNTEGPAASGSGNAVGFRFNFCDLATAAAISSSGSPIDNCSGLAVRSWSLGETPRESSSAWNADLSGPGIYLNPFEIATKALANLSRFFCLSLFMSLTSSLSTDFLAGTRFNNASNVDFVPGIERPLNIRIII